MPVGLGRGAEAIFVHVLVEITDDDVIRDVAGGCREVSPAPGSVINSVCDGAVEHYAVMALMKRSPKITANCAFAMVHSRGGILHSFSDLFKTR